MSEGVEKSIEIQLIEQICDAGEEAVRELIKIAKEPILGAESVSDPDTSKDDSDLAADKLTRAAQAKKIAIMDAFDIVKRIREERATVASELTGEATGTNISLNKRAKK